MKIATLSRYSDADPVVREVLVEDGWVVQPFADCDGFVSTLPSEAPDLIFVDVGSYGGELGWEIVQRITREVGLTPVPIVISSDDGLDLRNHVDRLRPPPAAVLVRPCTRGDVRRCLAAVTSGGMITVDTAHRGS